MWHSLNLGPRIYIDIYRHILDIHMHRHTGVHRHSHRHVPAYFSRWRAPAGQSADGKHQQDTSRWQTPATLKIIKPVASTSKSANTIYIYIYLCVCVTLAEAHYQPMAHNGNIDHSMTKPVVCTSNIENYEAGGEHQQISRCQAPAHIYNVSQCYQLPRGVTGNIFS